MEQIKPYIAQILLNHGYTQEELSEKTPNELKEIYTKGMQKYLQQFTQSTQQGSISQNPFATLKDPSELFEMPLDYFALFSLEDIILMLNKQFQFIPMEKSQQIATILFFAFQESLLQRIEAQISTLPKEEFQSILEIYEQHKNNIQYLLKIANQLEQEGFLSKLEKIMKFKTLIAES